MRKSKPKPGSRKKKPTAKAKENQSSVLKERLDAEFAKAVESAKSYVENPQRLQPLFEEAAKQAASMPKEPFAETWPYFQAMLRLIRAYSEGNYRDVPESTLVVIIAAIISIERRSLSKKCASQSGILTSFNQRSVVCERSGTITSTL